MLGATSTGQDAGTGEEVVREALAASSLPVPRPIAVRPLPASLGRFPPSDPGGFQPGPDNWQLCPGIREPYPENTLRKIPRAQFYRCAMSGPLGGSVPGVARAAQCCGVRQALCRYYVFERRQPVLIVGLARVRRALSRRMGARGAQHLHPFCSRKDPALLKGQRHISGGRHHSRYRTYIGSLLPLYVRPGRGTW
jgi:hypothetical protein